MKSKPKFKRDDVLLKLSGCYLFSCKRESECSVIVIVVGRYYDKGFGKWVYRGLTS